MKFVDPSAGYFGVIRQYVSRRTQLEPDEMSVLDVLAAYYYINCRIRDPTELCEVLHAGHGLQCEPGPLLGPPGIRMADGDSDEEGCTSSSSSSPALGTEAVAVPAGLE